MFDLESKIFKKGFLAKIGIYAQYDSEYGPRPMGRQTEFGLTQEEPFVRPIIMQLDLQSVEKVPFSAFAPGFAPKTLDRGLHRVRMSRELSPRSVQSCFPLLQGPSCRKSASALLRSNWVTNPDRIEKTLFSILSGVVILLDPVGSKKCSG